MQSSLNHQDKASRGEGTVDEGRRQDLSSWEPTASGNRPRRRAEHRCAPAVGARGRGLRPVPARGRSRHGGWREGHPMSACGRSRACHHPGHPGVFFLILTSGPSGPAKGRPPPKTLQKPGVVLFSGTFWNYAKVLCLSYPTARERIRTLDTWNAAGAGEGVQLFSLIHF